MKNAAARSSWRCNPLPALREPLGLQAEFGHTEWEKLKAGMLPADMDDKWFVFHEDGWLYCHRSWTGDAVFWFRFDGGTILESWVSRDQDSYRSQGIEEDRKIARELLKSVIAHQPRPPAPVR